MPATEPTATEETDTRRLLLLVSVVLAFEASLYAAVTPLLPTYARDLSLSDSAVGLLSAMYAIGVALGSVVGAWLCPRFGIRRVAVAGLLSLAGSSAVFGFATSLTVLDTSRAVSGLGAGFIWSAMLTWLVSAMPAERRGLAIGTVFGAAVFGTLVGPVIGTVALATGTAVTFSAVAVAAVLMLVPIFRFPTPAATALAPAGSTRRGLRDPALRTGIWFILFVAMMYGAVNVVVPLRLVRLGAADALVGVVFLAMALVAAVCSPIAGRAVDRHGVRTPATFGLIAGTPLIAMLAVPENVAALAILTILGVGGTAAFVSTTGAILISDRAVVVGMGISAASAAINLGYATGESLGALASAWLMDHQSDQAPFLLLALAGAATLAAVLRRWPRRPALSVS